MLRLVLCVIFIILKVKANVADTATENPVVRLCYSNDGNKNYTVWKDKPLKIIIEDGYPRYIWCRSSYYEVTKNIPEFIPTSEFNNDNIAKLYVNNVTAEMSTRWVCTVLRNYETPGPRYPYLGKDYTAKDLFFNLHVKRAKAVILSANNRNLTYVTTNQTVNYDGEANYTYIEGEDLEISCKKAEDDLDITSTVRLEYYNAAGVLMFETKSRGQTPHLFRTVLKSDNNNYYLECIHSTENPRRENRYRITFLKNKGSLQAYNNDADQRMILYVDGQELTTMFNKDPSYDDYIFRFLNEGTLNVTCRKKDSTLRGTLNCNLDPEYTDIQTLRKEWTESGAISVNISTSNLTNKTLTCGINNTDVRKPNARILFLYDELGHDVCIQGLARNNILYQYTNYDKQSTIEYQYSVNETLNLTCVSNIGFQTPPPSWQNLANADYFQWKFEGSFNFSKAVKAPSKPSMKWAQKTFTKTLDATYNTKKLRCIYFTNGMDQSVNKSVDLIFRLKPEIVAETNKVESPPAEDSKTQIIYIAVSVGAVIGIITMICLFLWRKRIKRTHRIQSEYDNLSNQNDSPIPAFPNQWETSYDDSNYARIDEGFMEDNDTYSTDTDKLYSMPSKRQSNTSENHYTEIDDIVRPKPAGIPVSWNNAHPSNFNKAKDPFKDSKQGTYNNLRHDNAPINKSNETYSNVQKTGKSKTVTFRQMSNDLIAPRNYSEGNSQQHCENKDRRFKQNSDGHYANGSQDIYMQPGDLQKKPNYENHLLQNEISVNNVYAEPYGDLGISCKNEFYG